MIDAARRIGAEFLGSLLLALVVIGSGISAQRLSPHDTGLQLLESAVATGAGLAVIILMFQPLSGAHINPVVSLADAALGHRSWRDLLGYLPAQFLGCATGALLANATFGLPAVTLSTTARASWPHLLAELIATATLVLLVFALVRTGRTAVAGPAVGALIAGAYFFTSSTSFANPAITVARMLSDTFAGIAPLSVLPFVGAQLLGGALGVTLVALLVPKARARTE